MSDQLSTIARLRGLLEVTRVVRADKDLPTLLSAIAATISEALGFRTVAINVYRPAWDDFHAAVVHGDEQARTALLGVARSHAEWEPLLDERFGRRGAFFISHDEIDWQSLGPRYVPELTAVASVDGWHPEDALLVPLRHTDGHLLGIVSVDEPVTGMRPSDDDLDVLVAVADHAAIAVQGAQETAAAQRHHRAVEQLLAVSSWLASEPSVELILPGVCEGIRDALGFLNVSVELVEAATGQLVPRASVGWDPADYAVKTEMSSADFALLLDPADEVEGCFLLSRTDAEERLGIRIARSSHQNGRGPHAWRDHWLVVPLRDREGTLIGVIWADEPEDRLRPSRDQLQALRVFANQTTAAILSAARFQEVRFLADHDPLTRLLNRRAFMARLDAEVARTTRYGRSFSLVVCDLDGFKALNDRYGHVVGDGALQMVGRVLVEALRRPDDAFRIGGDEFALILAEATQADAEEVVSRISTMLAEAQDERLVGISASFGIAGCPEQASDAARLFHLADEALYTAKRTRAGISG
jgi:diguanylate cyclase (GGDEF)-like protein